MTTKTLLVLTALSFLVVGCGDSNTSTNQTPTQPTVPVNTVPASAFGAGTHMVGPTISARRYFSDPSNGCYWERLSGLGGTLDEIIANDFVGFDSAQEIVAVAASDLAFSTNAGCGDWFTTPRHGMQTSIRGGRWLVGNQVAAGTYMTSSNSGCYWERLRNFGGSLDGIIANDFVGAPGNQLVSISGGDLGFSTNAECGTWTRVQTLTSTEGTAPDQSGADIENNRRLNEAQER